jgi:putative nucleotidyltransferase with HDIG domain
MNSKPNRDEAWSFLCEYVMNPSLRKHALAVEAVMRHFAALNDEDVEMWGVIGLLHDFDYERYPDQHCRKAFEILSREGIDQQYIHAICSHGFGLCSDIEPIRKMEKILYTIDELTGLIHAACLMRPSQSVLDIEVKSVKKKFKQSGFAMGVNREVINKGCQMLNLSLDEVIQETIAGMQASAAAIGLQGKI